MQVPEAAGGLTPKVSLGYSSQTVDGRTSASNNQASWIGDGWDYNPGSISRTYVNCRQDSKKAGANNATHKTADLCWGSENATLSLGGMTTELVWDESKDKWFSANGDGSKIERFKDTSKDPRSGMKDADGEYWVVTTKDGTKYHFGLNKLPGWSDNGTAADDPYTDSVLAVPVYGNHAGEPCYKGATTADWKSSACNQAWQWNLDYVEDVHGNAMSLWWEREKNYYAKNFYFKGPVEYHRGGYLKRIDYGQRKDTVFSATAPARVRFDVAERCFTEGTLTCSDENFTSSDPGKYRIWYDTPADLRCQAVTSTDKKKCWNSKPDLLVDEAPGQDHHLGPAPHRHHRAPGRRPVPAQAELPRPQDRPEHGPVAGVHPAHRLRPQGLDGRRGHAQPDPVRVQRGGDAEPRPPAEDDRGGEGGADRPASRLRQAAHRSRHQRVRRRDRRHLQDADLG